MGIVALALVLTGLIDLLIVQGLQTAIVQRKDLEREHLDSAFWIVLCLSLVAVALSYGLAVVYGSWTGQERVVDVVRWLALSWIVIGVSVVPEALLLRRLDFRTLALRSLLSTLVGGIVGIALALIGAGLWSLVAQQLVRAVVSLAVLWAATEWRPGIQLSLRHLKELYRFAFPLAGQSILWFLTQRTDHSVVGSRFGAVALGPYALASRIVELAISAVSVPFLRVAVPALSHLQTDQTASTRAFERFTEVGAMVAFPGFVGLLIVAPELILVIYGEQWLPAVPILQVLAVHGIVRVALNFFHPLLLASGRPGLCLITYASHTFGIIIGCLIASSWSPVAVSIAVLVNIVLYGIVWVPVFQRLLNIDYLQFFKSLSKPALACLGMAGAVLLARGMLSPPESALGALILQVFVGVISYTLFSWIVQPSQCREISSTVARHLLRRESD